MFEWFKKKNKNTIHDRVLAHAYRPIFSVREICSFELLRLKTTREYLLELQKDLRKAEDKDEDQCVKDIWQAMKFDPIIEHYDLGIIKLQEVLDNLPERPPEPDEYIVEYNGSDDDL